MIELADISLFNSYDWRDESPDDFLPDALGVVEDFGSRYKALARSLRGGDSGARDRFRAGYKSLDDDLQRTKGRYLQMGLFDNNYFRDAFMSLLRTRASALREYNAKFRAEANAAGYWKNGSDDQRYYPEHQLDAQKKDLALLKCRIPVFKAMQKVIDANEQFNAWYRNAYGFEYALANDEIDIDNLTEAQSKLADDLWKYVDLTKPPRVNSLSQWQKHSLWYNAIKEELPALQSFLTAQKNRLTEALGKRAGVRDSMKATLKDANKRFRDIVKQ